MTLNITTSTPKSQKRSRVSQKALLTTSAASILMLMAAAPMAQAQTDSPDGSMIAITDDTPVINPGSDTVITIAAGVTQTIADANADLNANILLDGQGDNDDVTITNAGTLINNDVQDQSGVITIDNAENNTVITNTDTGVFQGVNGVLFFEGDEVTLTNNGTIAGTGTASNAVVFFDRDAEDGRSNGEVPAADTEANTIINTGTISSVGGATIGFNTLLGIDPSSGTLGDEDGLSAFTLNNSGTISNSDAGDDDGSDAVNFNGNPGTLSGNPRGCLEDNGAGPQLNCQIVLDLDNSGTISTARDDADNAAIRSEDDAVLLGNITNTASGTITGASQGIFINGAPGQHNLTIDNAGAITGTSSSGVRITGDGVTLNNQAGGVITGGVSGLLVEGSTFDIDTGPTDIAGAALGVNNTFTNAGTISGGTASVDLTGAGEAVTFTQLGGGALTGCLLYTSPSPRDQRGSRMPSSA